MRLLLQGIFKFFIGLLLVGALIFWPAGGFDFWNGWLFIALLFIPMLFLGAYLFFKSPALLEKRLNGKEKEGAQKGIVAISALLFIAGFIVAGLDHRFGWSEIPIAIIIGASAVLLISYGLYAEVMRENAYLSRTIEVQEDQAVVSTGLYGIVRHPMYAATIGLFGAIPLVLGSWWAALCFIPYLPVIIARILNEEKILTCELAGYEEYNEKVKYRLIPFIW